MININEFDKKQIVFAFLNEGEKISFSNDNIIIRYNDGRIKHQSTCYRLFILFVIGHITITDVLIQKSHKFKFSIVLMNSSFKVYDFLGGKMEGNVLLRQYQYSYTGIDLAKHILLNKLHNQKQLLMMQRNKTDVLKAAINNIDAYNDRLSKHIGDVHGMMGFEGSAARIYFKNHFNNIEWQGRKPRIKIDFVNSILDIGYTVLFNFIEALLLVYGFDVYCGFLHKQFYMRKSLVCDIVEPFRPLIDQQVKKSINLGQFQKSDFTIKNHRYILKWECNGRYIGVLMKPIIENKHRIFLYVQAFYRAFMKHSEIKGYPWFELRE